MKFILLAIATVSAIKLEHSVPHDYGNEAAIASQHAKTMGNAGDVEGIRSTGINGQATSDKWRATGEKTEWVHHKYPDFNWTD